jgi:hypothetical protein
MGQILFSAINGISGKGILYDAENSGDVGGPNTQQSLLKTASDAIADGRPVIFRLRHLYPSGKIGSHFIVAAGRCGNQFIVSDPAGALTLYDPDTPGIFPFRGIRLFSLNK